MGFTARQVLAPLELEPEKDPVLEGLRERNRLGRNTILIISGGTRSGKSRLAGQLLWQIDPYFVQSVRDALADSNPATSPKVHASISPLPFFVTLKAGGLPKTAWWWLDEPVGVKNIEWWTVVSQALSDVLTTYAEEVVNLCVCTPILRKILRDIKDLAHVWIRMLPNLGPGNASVFKFKDTLDRKNPERFEKRTRDYLQGIRDAPLPPAEFEAWYRPWKKGNINWVLDTNIERLQKKGYIR